jgi:uncharacterized membrane protein
MDSVFLLGLAIPVGLIVGWWLGISAWRQVRDLRAEVARLRAAMQAAGIVVPEAAGMAVPEAAAVVAPRAASTAAPSPMAPATPPPGTNPWAIQATAPVPPAPPPRRGVSLEELLTLRWGTWLGAAALLLAGIFLVRMAVEEGWLGPAARCAMAGLLGVALVLAATWLRARPAPANATFPWPDQAPPALAAGGVAIMFGAAYAAAVMYDLLPPLPGFALMAAVALAGIALALLHGPVVAVVGILGAYLTPLLVAQPEPWLPGLFAYLALVTAAALAVLRRVGAPWLGWATTIAAGLWVVLGGIFAHGTADLWSPALFVPAVASLHLALLPGAALENAVGRRLAWVPFAVLAAAGLTLLGTGAAALPAAAALLLLTPIAVAKGATEPRLAWLPQLAALAGLVLLLLWPLAPWVPTPEQVTIEGVVQAILPGLRLLPEAVEPFAIAALLLAAMQAVAGLWMERRAPHPSRWAALAAGVPVLVLAVAYARLRSLAPDMHWAFAALALAAALVGCAVLAQRAAAPARAAVHAAGAVAALALGCAMLLSDAWLTLAVALFLPPLAWIEARAGLPGLRRVALVVAGLVLVRLLLNPAVLDYAFGTAPLLNGLLAAYGAPAACFALAAWMFRKRADDLTVAVLEAGAIAFATALVLLEMRHLVTGGAVGDLKDGWSFREGALQVGGLWLLCTALRLLDRRLGGRPVLGWGWRLQATLGVALGGLLILGNPLFDRFAQVTPTPLLNELLPAFAIPAVAAALAARSPEARMPRGFREVLAVYAFAASFAWVTLLVRHGFHPERMSLHRSLMSDAELYAYSAAWLVLGAALLALGIATRSRALRVGALLLMALTVAKALLVDMGDLVGLWRVLSFLALGLALIALGWVYRRFVVPAPAAGTS